MDDDPEASRIDGDMANEEASIDGSIRRSEGESSAEESSTSTDHESTGPKKKRRGPKRAMHSVDIDR